jgi:hypothetical protein
MYEFDPRTQDLSSGKFQCELLTAITPPVIPITKISVRDVHFDDIEVERIAQENTLFNMDPLCQKSSRLMFKKGEEQQQVISEYNVENCQKKNSCEWTP